MLGSPRLPRDPLCHPRRCKSSRGPGRNRPSRRNRAGEPAEAAHLARVGRHPRHWCRRGRERRRRNGDPHPCAHAASRQINDI